MWREVGGRSEYEAMPLGEAQELELSMIAEDARRADQLDEQQRKLDEREREMERHRRGY